jgi:hypothetical protein
MNYLCFLLLPVVLSLPPPADIGTASYETAHRMNFAAQDEIAIADISTDRQLGVASQTSGASNTGTPGTPGGPQVGIVVAVAAVVVVVGIVGALIRRSQTLKSNQKANETPSV